MSDGAFFANGLAGSLVAALAGLMLGRWLTASVSWSLQERLPLRRLSHLMAVAVAVGLWWWEVSAAGLTPRSAAGGLMATHIVSMIARWGSHLVFFALLSAATWIDIKHRVIPDWITVSGVVLGLVAAFLLPDPFLPIGFELERSFAPPLIVPDVLSAFGGLRSTPGPEWLGGAPHLGGVALVTSIFFAWWFFCTAPFIDPGDKRRMTAVGEPRNIMLLIGLVALVAAWFTGGSRFDAVRSSLIGLAVSAGLVWAIRAGASCAMGREAMGFGDVTLMAMIGAWLGWQPSILVFFLATFIGLAHGLVGLVLHRDNELPYGPSLCLAAVLVVVAWRSVWEMVGGFFADPLLLGTVLVAVVVLTAVALAVWQWVRGSGSGTA